MLEGVGAQVTLEDSIFVNHTDLLDASSSGEVSLSPTCLCSNLGTKYKVFQCREI